MPSDNSEIGDRTDVSAPATDDSVAQRRRRLAELVGRLLARTWLQRRREMETSETAGKDSPEESRSTAATDR